MSLRFETYRNVFMEISYIEQGGCVAVCNHPIEQGIIESRVFFTPREAFEDLKKILDRVDCNCK